MDSTVSDRNKRFSIIGTLLKYIFFGNLISIKKIDDRLQKIDSLQKAQAQTRGQIEGLKGGSGNEY